MNMSESSVKGLDRKEQYMQAAVRYYIYESENPDWSGLKTELENLGYTSSEVYCIMLGVREGDY